MSRKKNNSKNNIHKPQPTAPPAPLTGTGSVTGLRPSVSDIILTAQILLAGLTFFLTVCFSAVDTRKPVTLTVTILTIIILLITLWKNRQAGLETSVPAPILFLGVYTAVCGISVFYAVAPKFGLYEFLKILNAFCLALLLYMLARMTKNPSAFFAGSLCTAVTLQSLITLDHVSLQLVSIRFLEFLSKYNPEYSSNTVSSGLESHLYSYFGDPNVQASVTGLIVLISMSLAAHASGKVTRRCWLSLLYINNLVFLLLFSRGALLSIALALLTQLFTEKKEERGKTLLLLLKVFLISTVSYALVLKASKNEWYGKPVLLLIVMTVSIVLLWFLDEKAGAKFQTILNANIKTLLIISGAVLLFFILYFAAALNITASISLSPGQTLSRAVFPKPGDYTFQIEADGPLNLTVTSKSRNEVMLLRSTVLYDEESIKPSITVPQDSVVVYFQITNPSETDEITITSVTYTDEKRSYSVPLRYLLLPERLIGVREIFVTPSGVERTVFIIDGLKLFAKSPVIGLGLGAFEGAKKGIQSYYYETKYAHNHYIQALMDTGLTGLLSFLAVLIVSLFSAVKTAKSDDTTDPLLSGLSASVIFMAVCAGLEVSFSDYFFLPCAFSVIALIGLSCPHTLPKITEHTAVRIAAPIITLLYLTIYSIFLGQNIHAIKLIEKEQSLQALDKAIKLDKFEYADYMLSYVVGASSYPYSDAEYAQADRYAERLSEISSNTIPYYLAIYYFDTSRPEKAFEMLEKYVSYVTSDSSAWNEVFHVLSWYEIDNTFYQKGALNLIERMDEWNSKSIGTINLDQESQDFVDNVRRKN